MDKKSLKDTAKKSLSDFIQLEDGKLGKQDALMVGSALGASVLGQVLLSILEDNHADGEEDGYSKVFTFTKHNQASF